MSIRAMYRTQMAFMTLTLLSLANTSVGGADYHFLRDIPIGGAGGFDYVTIDPSARRLYASHGTKVVVIDIDKNSVAGEIADTPGIHGVAIVSEFKRGFTSNGREAKASIFDLESLKTLSKVETGPNP